MPFNNPFKYSDDNLRYHSFNYYLTHKYSHKVCKVPMDAGFTCPNRDGSKGHGGCRFCSHSGSGEFVQSPLDPLEKQFEDGLAIMHKKWPDAYGIAYFQAFSNTYAPISELEKIYTPFLNRDDIVEISIATRPDCLDEEKIALLARWNKQKPITIELGLQSIHDTTMDKMNRCHHADILIDCVKQLKENGLRVVLHIINGLPGEDETMMLLTAKAVADMKADGIKIHMLNVLNDAAILEEYTNKEFTLLTREEYVAIVVKQLEILPPEMVIERLTGDGMESQLVAPDWIKKKTIVLNEISKLQKALNSYQGKKYETGKY